jgi:hypothetical protein
MAHWRRPDVSLLTWPVLRPLSREQLQQLVDAAHQLELGGDRRHALASRGDRVEVRDMVDATLCLEPGHRPFLGSLPDLGGCTD